MLSAISPVVLAEDAIADDSQDGFLSRSVSTAEETRDIWSARWVSFAETMDRYFSSQAPPNDYVNESYIRIQLRETVEEQGELGTDARIKAKFDLPNTEKKAKLFFNSDADNDSNLEDRTRSNSTDERIRREESVAGLEFTPDSEWHKWKRSNRIGIRVRAPLVPFARTRLRRPFNDWGLWRREFQQEFWWYRDRGWGATSEYDMRRPLWGASQLRYFTVLEFEDNKDYWDHLQMLALSTDLTDRTSIEYRGGVLFNTENDARLTAYFVGINYRKRIHEDWVFLTVSPESYFAREDGWDAEASLTFRLDVYFSE
ncbi:MAG: hypothetical protein CMN82_08585 [Spongiibacter sp.]|nr:hypothetical protein [Spongiibacter sp.]MBI57041.1 hypothetical protein [Spongiibacter sp.]